MSFSSFVRCSSTPRSRFWLFQFGAQELVDGNSRGSDNGELDQILVDLCEQNMRQMEHRLSKHISGIAGSIPWGRGSRGSRGFTWTRERSRFRRAYPARRSPSHQRLSTKQTGPRRDRLDPTIPRWSVVSQQADFAADTKNLFKQPLLVAGVLAFHAKPYGIVSRAPLLSRSYDDKVQLVIVAFGEGYTSAGCVAQREELNVSPELGDANT